MWLLLSLQAVISCGLIGAVDGQVLSYVTPMVTECLAITPTASARPGGKPTENDPQARPGTVSYSMPICAACDCSTCTALSTYTTTFSAFCPTGLTDQTYTITETYPDGPGDHRRKRRVATNANRSSRCGPGDDRREQRDTTNPNQNSRRCPGVNRKKHTNANQISRCCNNPSRYQRSAQFGAADMGSISKFYPHATL
ncbi:hypothetical protein PG994_000584 [Apiospora phragmitis]|uniref:Uncharacterized protein n=1 Tax=Apiospora phragmitis TaxID=2905665 RepID=A0ABR1X6U8_9PEZI